jgi:hypothetical protein
VQHRAFSKLATWGTIAFECAFILVLSPFLLPPCRS